jgi:hypothetical protein
MKHIWEVNGRTNGKQSGSKEPSVGEGPGNNRYAGAFVAMARSGSKLLMMWERIHFNRLSLKKLHRDLQLSVLIPGKHAYTGIAARGYVHRLVNHGEQQYSDGNGNHINGLEGFWGFLKRKLVAKGGIRKEKLPLYLGEYVWRYNHRNDSDLIKIKRIIKLLEQEV